MERRADGPVRCPRPVDCRRRRHQPRRPALAKIRPGSPAPAMGPGTADARVIVKPPSAKQPTPDSVSSVPVGILVGWSSGCVLRAARPPEAAISELPRSRPACLRDWHRVARADLVTLVLGAVWNPHAWRNALRGGACRNPGQGNPGGQDESGETHGGTSLWVEPNKGAATRLPL